MFTGWKHRTVVRAGGDSSKRRRKARWEGVLEERYVMFNGDVDDNDNSVTRSGTL
jgi:hypothetical protein